ncbi:N-acetylmuramoyl-L-alanine amidase [Acidocella sp.]|uniref:N-acetylmuramoyl-L-alanine amidase n=1 Tax=Acidocella sp. TaxID=50710 RepID=UPI002613FBC6|nr:N-acetylmuramoyl-L-alanine amidase [Acidocella sp.]
MIFIPSPNFAPRESPVEFLVLHYTGMKTAQAAIDLLRDPAAEVSAHYVVDEDGTITQLVEEQNRAWHAGLSYWRGRAALNDSSIGIEIVNPGHEWGYRAFPPAQIAAVIALCQAILARHPIPARNVVAHSDIAPTRKRDPGELFPWPALARHGVGLWTDEFTPGGELLPDLARLGYDITQPAAAVITAFQRHFLPHNLSGQADAPTTARARALRQLVDPAARSG